jgi:hypothetical protein
VLGAKDISEIGAARAAALTPFGAPRSLPLQAGEGEAPARRFYALSSNCSDRFSPGSVNMSIQSAILATQPTSYWPLDDSIGASCHDQMGLHDASAPAAGVNLAAIPFGAIRAPYFDGALGSSLDIDSDPRYSQPYANALTVAAWICPLALDNAKTAGASDQFVYFLNKAVSPSTDSEWAMRLYNQTNPTRHSRLSFYTFNLGFNPDNKGNGSYMEYGCLRTTRRRSNWVSGFSL